MKFGRLTGEHVPIGDFQYKLAIVLDDVLQTAPNLHERDYRYRPHYRQFHRNKKCEEIVDIINAGSLPAALEPTPVRDMIVDGSCSKRRRPGA